MQLKEFKAESKRLLDLMINSIYTHKEIFIRELISNASDAIDKMYYKALTEEDISFNKSDYVIKIDVDKEKRLLRVRDSGIGMTKEELEENLGIIAKSGSLVFKAEHEKKEEVDLIGQFGVGFYSAFMVADVVTVTSCAYGQSKAFKWEAKGIDGYTIEAIEEAEAGTEVLLKIKENTEDEDFDRFLDEMELVRIVKKYSDFIRYPIKMTLTKSRAKEGSEGEYESVKEEETINSMVPIWKKNKNELKKEDYENFYQEKRYGFDTPIQYIHIHAEGMINYRAILFIPEKMPYDYYNKEYEKGLELYSNGVLIMNKCADLLPDYFSFVKGMVDSEDLSLNISREMLQHDRQLRVIAKNIKGKIKNELMQMLAQDREKYDKFYDVFGSQLKYGAYSDFGMNKDFLQELLLFYSSKEKKRVTLKEYVERMPEEQKYIYYAVGPSIDRIDKQPQIEKIVDKGYEFLYLLEDLDEFVIKVLSAYEGKEFKSAASGDLGWDEEEFKEQEQEKEDLEIYSHMKEILGDKVKEVRLSKRLKQHPVCLTNEGDISIEMEKVLNMLPNQEKVEAEKILEINQKHKVFEALKGAYEKDKAKFRRYTELLYQQALLIEGLPIEDPVAFSNQICEIME